MHIVDLRHFIDHLQLEFTFKVAQAEAWDFLFVIYRKSHRIHQHGNMLLLQDNSRMRNFGLQVNREWIFHQ